MNGAAVRAPVGQPLADCRHDSRLHHQSRGKNSPLLAALKMLRRANDVTHLGPSGTASFLLHPDVLRDGSRNDPLMTQAGAPQELNPFFGIRLGGRTWPERLLGRPI
jgi:hypothetical protein